SLSGCVDRPGEPGRSAPHLGKSGCPPLLLIRCPFGCLLPAGFFFAAQFGSQTVLKESDGDPRAARRARCRGSRGRQSLSQYVKSGAFPIRNAPAGASIASLTAACCVKV